MPSAEDVLRPQEYVHSRDVRKDGVYPEQGPGLEHVHFQQETLCTIASPINRPSPSTERTAGGVHGEEADWSPLQPARLRLGDVAS